MAVKATEVLKERLELIKKHYAGEVKDYEEALEIGIEALETIQKLSDRKMTAEILENYMQFEDECVKKGFTLKSVIEARDKQIAKKPITYPTTNRADCPICLNTVRGIDKPFGNYCSNCGQRLDFKEE